MVTVNQVTESVRYRDDRLKPRFDPMCRPDDAGMMLPSESILQGGGRRRVEDESTLGRSTEDGVSLLSCSEMGFVVVLEALSGEGEGEGNAALRVGLTEFDRRGMRPLCSCPRGERSNIAGRATGRAGTQSPALRVEGSISPCYRSTTVSVVMSLSACLGGPLRCPHVSTG